MGLSGENRQVAVTVTRTLSVTGGFAMTLIGKDLAERVFREDPLWHPGGDRGLTGRGVLLS